MTTAARRRIAFQACRRPLAQLVLGLALLGAAAACGPSPRAAVTMSIAKPTAPTPGDASVYIDEQYVGTLSVVAARGVRLPVGTHRITVQKVGYFPWDRLIEADREEVNLQVELIPIPD